MKKRIIGQIIAMTMILCIMSGLEARIPNPNFDPNLRQSSRTNIFAEGWRQEQVTSIRVSQPDGIEIDIEVVDGGVNNPMHFCRMNGFTIIFDQESKYWYWAHQAEDGTLESTGFPAHLYDPEELGLEKNIRMSNERAEMMREFFREFLENNFGPFNYNNRSTPPKYTSPHDRHVNKIVIYVSLYDQDLNFIFPTAIYNTRYNDLNSYYHAVSYGKLNLVTFFS